MSIVKYYSPRRLRRTFFEDNITSLPATDVIEQEDSYLVQLNLPGFSQDEISVEADFEKVEIVAEHKEEKTDEKEDDIKYLHRERYRQKFTRVLKFRKPIKAKDAKITHENGVLTITLPFAEEAKTVKLSIN